MNQYHIYEAIGRGKYSTVYKGRKKKTIEYYAVKSVDKSQKSTVLQEVRILHSLYHPNILKFYSWYETSAHLWLVLEYCVGGDLMNLLQQDTKMPEDSVHDMAAGLVVALQFLHSKGVVYCDLKPSNILLDENGHTKLCDFGLARKLSDISKTPFSELPQAKRGTPCYMAPELFQDGGVHSFASDLWALGCVLFECYAGRPPFVGKELTQLIKSILSDPAPVLPGSPSRPFVNLINSLLIKDPAERIQWVELCSHAFWRSKFDTLPLPSQPAFTDMVELSSKPCLSERTSEKPLQSKTPTKREKDAKSTIKEDENSTMELKGRETPIKGAFSSRKTQTKASSRVADNKLKDTPNTRGVNLLRLSRIAKTNLQRENEKENYRRPLPNGQENDAEVEINNNDMELDFNENPEDEANDEADGSENVSCHSESNLSTPIQDDGKIEDVDGNQSHSETSSIVDTPISDGLKTFEQETSSELAELTPMPPSSSPQPKTAKVKDSSGFIDSDCSSSSTNISQVLWHPSDLSVRPVMPNRKSDKGSDLLPSVPFDALSASDFVKMSKEQLDNMNNRIIGVISGNTTAGEKQTLIRYLETISSNADAANVLTNGPIMLVLVKVFRQSKTSALRAQLASLIGLLIRHSTVIGDDLANSGILGSLTDGLRDKQEKVRRFSMAALGELLFYISTQNEQSKTANPPEVAFKDNRTSSGWQVSNSLISLVSSVLRNGEDDLTQLYALRTIENISSQGGYWATRFTGQDVISNLCYIFRAPGKQESMRLTAGSCLVRLTRFNPPTIIRIMDKVSFKDMASSLVKASPREQQIRLNLLSMAMVEITNIGKYLPVGDDKNIVPNVVSLIEQGSEILKGKALIFVALLCKNGRRWLPQFFCNARLLSDVDRLVKEKDNYVQQCLNAFAHVVASAIPSLLETVIGEIQQSLGGRRRGQFAGFTGRNPPKSNIHLFPVILNLLGSSLFKHRVVNSGVLQQFANLLKLAETPFQGRDEFQVTLLKVLESIAEEPPIAHQSCEIFIQQILPSLAILYKGNKDGDARFLCLKIMFDSMVIFLNEPALDENRAEDLKSICNSHFLLLYPSLIEDEDPIPMYAQKLLVMLIEFDYVKISDILQTKTVAQCFEFLLGDFSTANVSNVMLCLALVSAPELETRILSQLKVVRKIGNLLEFVCAKEMEDFIEPTLNLCRAFLLRPVGARKGSLLAKEPKLLYDNSASEGTIPFDHQECIRDMADFGDNVGVLLELAKANEKNVSDLASECLILLFKVSPREATTGYLTSLPKVAAILEQWNQGIPHLLLQQRVLHALGYSCRQYLSHSMILSLSIPDILRIEAIISEMRRSNTPTLADAAFQVAKELQRLPRRI